MWRTGDPVQGCESYGAEAERRMTRADPAGYGSGLRNNVLVYASPATAPGPGPMRRPYARRIVEELKT